MKYGRSLSACVKDILDGKVKKEDVGVIVTSTAFKSLPLWLEGITFYWETYWSDYSLKESIDIVCWLLDNNKIEQPRLKNGKIQTLYKNKHWADTYQEVIDSLE